MGIREASTIRVSKHRGSLRVKERETHKFGLRVLPSRGLAVRAVNHLRLGHSLIEAGVMKSHP